MGFSFKKITKAVRKAVKTVGRPVEKVVKKAVVDPAVALAKAQVKMVTYPLRKQTVIRGTVGKVGQQVARVAESMPQRTVNMAAQGVRLSAAIVAAPVDPRSRAIVTKPFNRGGFYYEATAGKNAFVGPDGVKITDAAIPLVLNVVPGLGQVASIAAAAAITAKNVMVARAAGKMAQADYDAALTASYNDYYAQVWEAGYQPVSKAAFEGAIQNNAFDSLPLTKRPNAISTPTRQDQVDVSSGTGLVPYGSMPNGAVLTGEGSDGATPRDEIGGTEAKPFPVGAAIAAALIFL